MREAGRAERRLPPGPVAGGVPPGYKLAAVPGVASHTRAAGLNRPYEDVTARSPGEGADSLARATGTADASRRHGSRQSGPRRQRAGCHLSPGGVPGKRANSLQGNARFRPLGA